MNFYGLQLYIPAFEEKIPNRGSRSDIYDKKVARVCLLLRIAPQVSNATHGPFVS